MSVRVTQESRPARQRRAIAFCCDARYLPFAALAAETALAASEKRDFDVLICSTEPLAPPPGWHRDEVRMCVIDTGTELDGLRVSERFSATAYLRLALPAAFADDYDRILYLDCDVFAAGRQLDLALALDLKERPLGAVADNMKWKRPGRATWDQRAVGATGDYFNSGVLLIDTARFEAEGIRRACVEAARGHREDSIHYDQTLLNLGAAGRWTELHPAWNWQWTRGRPFFEMLVDVQMVHFIGRVKPWSDPKGQFPVRYRRIAERFLSRHFPEAGYQFGMDAGPLRMSRLLAVLFRHFTRARDIVRVVNRFGPDITVTKPVAGPDR